MKQSVSCIAVMVVGQGLSAPCPALGAAGDFGPEQVISTVASGAWSVFAADIDGDGDGDADVLSASSVDDKIAWYENTDGLGSFGPQRIIDPTPAMLISA